ncbi:hypothetical protein [Anaeromyxobacter oryzae]|uniref:ZU5 domain-containing protein n=1 Tax=Anaeromyxobacter oryzae TaxID=2918170 RepID=A0ABM7X0C7_9BACT|nr:hypothetical protein [Anaeromyxobacter oryzae]BDG05255.1 hypothetical protein AMOR_42510 [Anaeromyxobacter oryzae]
MSLDMIVARRRAVPFLVPCALAAALAACGGGPRASSSSGTTPTTRPTPTPVGAPIGVPVSAHIDAAGGELATPDGLLEITIPPGAISAPQDFTIQEIVNYAPGSIGGAYRLGPDGTKFAKPVSITFKADVSAHDLDDLAIAYQDAGSGYWVRPAGAVRDRAAGTVTVTTPHFSDWTLVTSPSDRDLVGTFTLTQSLALPFTASGSATLNYAGENGYESFYLVPGTITAPSQIPFGTSTCAPSGSAAFTLPVQLAEMIKSPGELEWGINAYWDLTCTAVGGQTSPNIISTQFDTAGINLIGCSRQYDGTPIVGPQRAQGSYTIDCGTKGTVRATWDFQSSVCGTPCTPANVCDTGVYSCTTGSAVCVDTGTPVASGTTCGTDMVCNAGTCTACTANVACTPANACDTGLTSCSTGTSTCVDTGTPVANGTSCGTDMVCNTGVCNACTANAACTPANACDAGVTSCSTGTQVCLDTGTPLANGTTCGTNEVCNAGVCSACTAGVACTPANACDTGVTSCSTGTQVCLDTGTPVANGTSCGTNQVCNAGACSACTANVACTPANPCDAGVTSCSTGAQTCVDTGTPLANGTSCGTNQVCNAGACNACTANVACTPANKCDAGLTSCSTGTQTCADTGTPVANGTSCGTNQVCNAGACTACTANVACTPTNPCDTGLTSCSTGTQTCTDTGTAVANGTSCGTNQVCNAGACTACTANVACTPTNACHDGVTSCSTGTQTCTDTGTALANGASCGAGESCNAGTCVASSTVTGTRDVTFWPDAGAGVPAPAPDVATASVQALAPDGTGGWIAYPGTFAADGSFSIPNVPAGSYLLALHGADGVSRVVATSSTTVDLGYDVLGRSDAADPTASTPVTVDMTGLEPWTAGDEVQLVSSNADVWDSVPVATVGDGAVAAAPVEDWLTSAAGGPLHLLAAGDTLAIFQLHTTPASGSLPSYLSAAAVATAQGLTLASGTPATIPAALAPPASTGTLDVDWNVGAFEALLPAMGPPAATATGHTLAVGASAHPLTFPAPASRAGRFPTLLRMEVPGGSGQTSVTFPAPPAYGHVLDATWNEWREVGFTATTSYVAPGATTPVDAVASVGRREAMATLAAGPIAPTLTPVQSPLVGSSALSSVSTPTPVGSAPVVAWTAPATGTPTHYLLEIFQLSASGSASSSSLVASFVTGATQVQLPPGVLSSGSVYYARITASASASDPFATQPIRSGGASAWASTLTGTFTP